MSNILQSLFPCLPLGTSKRGIKLPDEPDHHHVAFEKAALEHADAMKRSPLAPLGTPQTRLDEAAASIVLMIRYNDDPGMVELYIRDQVRQAGGWSEYLAEKVLSGLKEILKAGKAMSATLKVAWDRACEAAKAIEGFAEDHPVATEVFLTVVALGVLVVLAPYAVEYLGFCAGFGELGPVEGSWAAAWQSTYGGLVPKGSLFSFFQRLGMTWSRT